MGDNPINPLTASFDSFFSLFVCRGGAVDNSKSPAQFPPRCGDCGLRVEKTFENSKFSTGFHRVFLTFNRRLWIFLPRR